LQLGGVVAEALDLRLHLRGVLTLNLLELIAILVSLALEVCELLFNDTLTLNGVGGIGIRLLSESVHNRGRISFRYPGLCF
jgi:hypothetical protein